MANLVVTRTATGGHRITQSYFSIGVVIDVNGNAVSPRIANTNNTPVVGIDGDRFVFRTGDWLHLLPNIAAAGGANGLTNPVIGRYASNNLATISGVTVELGDRLEIPPTLARTFTPAIPGGIYRYVSLSPPTIQITDPPIYNLSHANEVGGAVYYRANPNVAGGLEGLAVVPLTAGTVSQGRPEYPISNMPGFIDGDPNSYADGRHLNWQNASMNINKVENILAFAWTIGSNRASWETSSTDAVSQVTVASENGGAGSRYVLHSLSTTVNASTLARHSSTLWANSASGRATFYAYLTTPTSVGWIQCSEGNSRTYYYDFKAIGFGRDCRIRLNNGVFPEAGSIINISQDVARTFWPAIQPGAYPVINNSGTGPWQLGARFDLITTIGAAINYSLYVDSSQYNGSFNGAIRMEVGSLYQLRINTPEAATTAEYRIAQSGGTEEAIGASTNARSNFSVFFTPTVAQYNRALAGETAKIWAVCNGQARPKRFNLEITYTNKGRVNTPASGAFISRLNDIVVSVGPDPARTFQSFAWRLSDANGIVNQGTSTTTSTTAVPSFTTPAGDYTIAVEITYTDTDRPIERFNVPITVLEFPEAPTVTDNNGTRTLTWPGGGSLVMPTTPDGNGNVTIVATAPTTPTSDPYISYFVTQIRSDGSRGQQFSFINTFTVDSTQFSGAGVAALEIIYETQSGRRFEYTLTF